MPVFWKYVSRDNRTDENHTQHVMRKIKWICESVKKNNLNRLGFLISLLAFASSSVCVCVCVHVRASSLPVGTQDTDQFTHLLPDSQRYEVGRLSPEGTHTHKHEHTHVRTHAEQES